MLLVTSPDCAVHRGRDSHVRGRDLPDANPHGVADTLGQVQQPVRHKRAQADRA